IAHLLPQHRPPRPRDDAVSRVCRATDRGRPGTGQRCRPFRYHRAAIDVHRPIARATPPGRPGRTKWVEAGGTGPRVVHDRRSGLQLALPGQPVAAGLSEERPRLMDADLRDLLSAWLGGDDPGDERRDVLLERLRTDAAFRLAFVNEIHML